MDFPTKSASPARDEQAKAAMDKCVGSSNTCTDRSESGDRGPTTTSHDEHRHGNHLDRAKKSRNSNVKMPRKMGYFRPRSTSGSRSSNKSDYKNNKGDSVYRIKPFKPYKYIPKTEWMHEEPHYYKWAGKAKPFVKISIASPVTSAGNTSSNLSNPSFEADKHDKCSTDRDVGNAKPHDTHHRHRSSSSQRSRTPVSVRDKQSDKIKRTAENRRSRETERNSRSQDRRRSDSSSSSLTLSTSRSRSSSGERHFRQRQRETMRHRHYRSYRYYQHTDAGQRKRLLSAQSVKSDVSEPKRWELGQNLCSCS